MINKNIIKVYNYMVKKTFSVKTLGKELSSCCTLRIDGLGICPKIRSF